MHQTRRRGDLVEDLARQGPGLDVVHDAGDAPGEPSVGIQLPKLVHRGGHLGRPLLGRTHVEVDGKVLRHSADLLHHRSRPRQHVRLADPDVGERRRVDPFDQDVVAAVEGSDVSMAGQQGRGGGGVEVRFDQGREHCLVGERPAAGQRDLLGPGQWPRGNGVPPDDDVVDHGSEFGVVTQDKGVAHRTVQHCRDATQRRVPQPDRRRPAGRLSARGFSAGFRRGLPSGSSGGRSIRHVPRSCRQGDRTPRS